MNKNILLISYRKYAKSSKTPTENGIYNDNESAINFTIDSLKYTENKISIFGHSLNNTITIHISQHRNFKNLVLITPLTSGKKITSAIKLGFLKFIAKNSYNSLEKINNVNSKVLIIHEDKDKIVPYQIKKKLFQTYNETKQIMTIADDKHNDLAEINPMLY